MFARRPHLFVPYVFVLVVYSQQILLVGYKLSSERHMAGDDVGSVV